MFATLVSVDNHHRIFMLLHTKIMLFCQITATFTFQFSLFTLKKTGLTVG